MSDVLDTEVDDSNLSEGAIFLLPGGKDLIVKSFSKSQTAVKLLESMRLPPGFPALHQGPSRPDCQIPSSLSGRQSPA